MLESDVKLSMRVKIWPPADLDALVISPKQTPASFRSYGLAGPPACDGVGEVTVVPGTTLGGYADALVKLDVPWNGYRDYYVLPIWLEPEMIYMKPAPISSLFPKGMTYVTGNPWVDPSPVVGFTGFCDPATHPEFRGWCGGHRAHRLGCPHGR